MVINIRDATTHDLPFILNIINDAIVNTTAVWTEEPATLDAQRSWLEGKQAQQLPVLVAEGSSKIVGFAALSAFRPWPGYAQTVEHSIYVDSNSRGLGVGGCLLQALVLRATALGHHAMIAGIEAGNSASIALHRRGEFGEVGRLSEVGRKFGRWLDLVFMQRLLPRAETHV